MLDREFVLPFLVEVVPAGFAQTAGLLARQPAAAASAEEGRVGTSTSTPCPGAQECTRGAPSAGRCRTRSHQRRCAAAAAPPVSNSSRHTRKQQLKSSLINVMSYHNMQSRSRPCYVIKLVVPLRRLWQGKTAF